MAAIKVLYQPNLMSAQVGNEKKPNELGNYCLTQTEHTHTLHTKLVQLHPNNFFSKICSWRYSSSLDGAPIISDIVGLLFNRITPRSCVQIPAGFGFSIITHSCYVYLYRYERFYMSSGKLIPIYKEPVNDSAHTHTHTHYT